MNTNKTPEEHVRAESESKTVLEGYIAEMNQNNGDFIDGVRLNGDEVKKLARILIQLNKLDVIPGDFLELLVPDLLYQAGLIKATPFEPAAASGQGTAAGGKRGGGKWRVRAGAGGSKVIVINPNKTRDEHVRAGSDGKTRLESYIASVNAREQGEFIEHPLFADAYKELQSAEW